MKKVINGKLYNTETAEEVASWTNGYTTQDFNYCEETLYRTKNGNYFLHGFGGALSKYAVPVPGGTGGEHKIIPLDKDGVIEWMENTDNVDILLQLFPDDIEEA